MLCLCIARTTVVFKFSFMNEAVIMLVTKICIILTLHVNIPSAIASELQPVGLSIFNHPETLKNIFVKEYTSQNVLCRVIKKMNAIKNIIRQHLTFYHPRNYTNLISSINNEIICDYKFPNTSIKVEYKEYYMFKNMVLDIYKPIFGIFNAVEEKSPITKNSHYIIFLESIFGLLLIQDAYNTSEESIVLGGFQSYSNANVLYKNNSNNSQTLNSIDFLMIASQTLKIRWFEKGLKYLTVARTLYQERNFPKTVMKYSFFSYIIATMESVLRYRILNEDKTEKFLSFVNSRHV